MGGAVSAGRDNDELIDNLKGGKYIRTPRVERVFRALDRADYMLPHSRDTAYKDLAWKDGPLHLSAPCIYSEVMEGLELRKGLSFLNVGSGTGYLSTMVGLILGSSGINHGIEIHPAVIEYANHRHQEFIMKSWSVDEFDFCEPKFVLGNGLCLAPLQAQYERVYCGAGCPEEYANYFKQLVKVGGILVMPLMDSLIQVRRVTQSSWVTRSLLSVSFAQLKVPSKEDTENLVKLDDISPPTLQVLCRAVIRNTMRDALLSKYPHLVPAPRRLPPRSVTGPRRICIPVEEDSDVETFSILHDLDTNNGGNEMNALLNLVLSMGQNRVAGSLLYDHQSTSSSSSSSSSPSMTCVVNSSAESDAESDDPSAPEGDDEQGSSRSRASDRRARSTTPMPTDAPDAGGTVSSNNDQRENSPGHDSTSDESDDQNKAKRIKSKLRSKSKKRQRGQNKREPHAACTSSMEWDDAAVATTSDAATTSKSGSSQSEGNGDAKEKSKRQKFDSGIGEENSPENSSSVEKTETKSDESEYSDCSSDILDEGEKDEPDDGSRGGGTRRDGRAMKRSRHGTRARSSDSEDEEVQRGPRRRTKKRTKAAASADREISVEEQRRSTLTAHMKLASNMLPLPPPLRLFVNLGRAY